MSKPKSKVSKVVEDMPMDAEIDDMRANKPAEEVSSDNKSRAALNLAEKVADIISGAPEKLLERASSKEEKRRKDWFKFGNDYENFWKGHIGHEVTVHCKDGSEHNGKLKACLFQQMNIILDMEGVHRVFRGDAIDWVDIPRGKIQ
jgi:hypothetical protein